MRLSALRASTSPPATRGVASTSLDTRARQRGLPVSASSANRSPRSDATATVRVLAPTPAERRTASSTCHSSSPLAAFRRVTEPSREVAYRLSPSSAGLKAKSPPLPTLADHSTRRSLLFSSTGNSAGFGALEPPHHEQAGSAITS